MVVSKWKVCIHWSAGSYDLIALDHIAYHFTVDKTGKVQTGQYKPEDNTPPSIMAGRYAKHCGGGNTNCIGISMLGMAGFKGRDYVGAYPLTAPQCESTWQKVAKLCKEYEIPITPERVFTHYEFGKLNPNTSSAGKIDITYLPTHPELKAEEVGDYIRNKVKVYFEQLG